MTLKTKLDKFQYEAVKTNEKNVLVVAAPGSGKTTTIVNRVFYLINEKTVDPSSIIVITFTRAAADNMKKRYLNMSPSKKSPFFGTFHGLFYKIVRRHCCDFKIIEAWQAFRVIKSVLSTYIDDVSEDKIKEVLNYISLYKTSMGIIDEESLNLDKGIFQQCLKEYEEFKDQYKLLDFDDLQLKCREIFINNPDILEGYRKLFKHILVDEFQDSDLLQIEILKLLGHSSSIFAVGDEDQCIYGFRGSRPDCMVDFNKHFPGGKKIYLSNNYRSPKNIVQCSLRVIENNSMRNKKEIYAVNEVESPINIINTANESMQAEEIAQNIIKLKEISDYDFKDNAVLYRTNVESRSLIDAFIRKRIPFKFMDKDYNFFEHFICKDIIAYLRLSIDKYDKDSFSRIINKPFRYISKVSLEKVMKSSLKDDCFEMLKEMENVHPFQIKSIDRLKKDIHYLNKVSLRTAVDLVITDLGYHDHIKEYSKKYKVDINDLEDIIDEFRESTLEYNTIITFLAHVEEVKEQLENNKKIKKEDEDAVVFSTIHGVKGMEYKNVFIINCNEEYIPHSNSIEQNLEEERRLFYVGITRTINNLWIGISQSIKGKMKTPSRFLSELDLDKCKDLESAFKVGDKVFHKSFGAGLVKNTDKNNIEILFKDNISRKFDALIIYSNGLIKKE